MNDLVALSSKIAFICQVFISVDLHGQGYVQLIDTTNIWHDGYWSSDPGPAHTVVECNRYWFDGDTMFDGVSLKVLRKTGSLVSGSSQSTNGFITTWYHNVVHALIREDTLTHRAYIRLSDPPSFEQLFYDFGAEIGPYPDSYRFQGSSGVIVISIDTIETEAGPRKRLNLNNGHTIVQGIGSIKGLMPQTYTGQLNIGGLTCHIHNDVEIINGGTSFTCHCSFNVGVAEQRAQGLKLWPSPTRGILYMERAMPHAAYTVRDASGRIVSTGLCDARGIATIDLSGSAPSVYMLVVDDGKRTMRAKVIKE